MPVNIEIAAFPLDANLEKALETLMNSQAAAGFRLVTSFSAPVVGGQITVYFVFQKGD